jgi:hypothetical protein
MNEIKLKIEHERHPRREIMKLTEPNILFVRLKIECYFHWAET